MTLGIFDPAFLAVAGTVVSGGYDADAQAYITAVEAADGQALETGVKDAINAFVVGCKADGIWNAIKASCILAGARTLSGALVPLVGAAPTSFNFVSGDYNRKTGLVGNGSTKYLNSNRGGALDPQNDRHISVFVSSLPTSSTRPLLGQARTATDGASFIYNDITRFASVGSDAYTAATGLIGLNRTSSTSYTVRTSGDNTVIPKVSIAPLPQNYWIYADNPSGILYSNARIAFYSIGEALDLALLDARVTALMYEIQKTLLEGDFDIDAAAYISRVETEDGQDLEPAVRTAINNFVIGCKADGIWNAIKASCILAGARTLNGALMPLVGAAPTNFNFVSGDYDRKTGLVGNGSNKYLNSNRANNADPQDSNHNACYATAIGQGVLMAAGTGSTNGQNYMDTNSASNTRITSRSSSVVSLPGTVQNGLYGINRNASTSFTVRTPQSGSVLQGTGSQVPSSLNVLIYGRTGTAFFSNARIAFYSIGESLDLALLDARVTTLINALGAAIP